MSNGTFSFNDAKRERIHLTFNYFLSVYIYFFNLYVLNIYKRQFYKMLFKYLYEKIYLSTFF